MSLVRDYSSLRYLIILSICLLFPVIRGKGTLYELDESNWDEIVQGEWMVEFFAPWCPACKALTPIWKEFADWSEDLGIKVGQVDVTSNPGLSGRFMVTALPTIYHVKDGEFRQYRGSRDKESFINFIEDKKWQTVESIPSWKSPQSYQMSAVSYFFKLSMMIRSIHTKLVDEFGVPYWASYIIFALATIVLGAILGLIVVCIIDLIFPPRHGDIPLPKYDYGDKKVDNDKERKDHASDEEDEDEKEEEEDDDDEDDDDDDEERKEGDDAKTDTTKESSPTDELRQRKAATDAKSA